MATIPSDFGKAGKGVTSDATPDLATVVREIADDLAELRTRFVAVLAKLDADVGVTDTNYTATQTPAVLKTVKGT